MTRYPMYVNYAESIPGNGFLATLKVKNGRAIMVREDDEWWMYGVCPGGISAGGATPQEAYLRYCESFKEILEDIAFDGRAFESFKTETKLFVQAVDKIEEAEWLSAREAFRAGAKAEGPFDALNRVTTEPILSVEVDRLDVKKSFDVAPAAADNQLAAAA